MSEKAQTEKTQIRSMEIAFDEHSWKRVQEIKTKAGLKDRPNSDLLVMRNALVLYEWFLGEIASGGEIGVVRDGRVHKHQLEFD